MMSAMQTHESSGGRLVTADGKTLPLKSVELTADAKGGLARVILAQTFANPYAEPLAVTYQLALPADAAVSGFAFTIGDQRIVGEVDRKARARERFEEAILEGRTASLLDQERSSLFTQQVGNIPPGQEVRCEIALDQRLAWSTEGGWEWRFPTVVAPRYLGHEARVPDAAQVTVDVAEAPLPIRFFAGLTVRDGLVEGGRPESPSHALETQVKAGTLQVSLAQPETGAPALDRDVVIRWKVAKPKVGLTLDVARPASGHLAESAYGLLTLVPPAQRAARSVRRDLIVLLDTSGSMSGEPLAQACKVTSALIETLGDEDRLELIEFSDAPRRWKPKAVNATAKHKAAALSWLGKLRASGGTEMRSGIYEALATLDDEAQRQVILVTDGLIGFEHEVVRTIAEKCPAACRVHTVGVGSGVNRSLTGPAARAGRGAEEVISLGEDPERAARRLVARTDAPTVVEVELSGTALVDTAPGKLPDLFAGSPVLASLKLRPSGGTLVARGRTAEGEWVERLELPAVAEGQGSAAVVALFGRERVEDLELQVASGKGGTSVDALIESLGLMHQISTRLTSWVAVSVEAMVDPTAPSRRETVPQNLPFGMSVTGLGLRAARAMPARMVSRPPMAQASGGPPPPSGAPAPMSRVPMKKQLRGAAADRAKGRFFVADEVPDYASPEKEEEGTVGGAPSPAPAAKPAPAKESRSLLGALARWVGRTVLRTAKELVLEVIGENPFTWDSTQPVTVTFADGTTRTLEVDAKRSTRAGEIAAGTVLRIVLVLGEDVPEGKPVNVSLPGVPDGTVHLQG